MLFGDRHPLGALRKSATITAITSFERRCSRMSWKAWFWKNVMEDPNETRKTNLEQATKSRERGDEFLEKLAVMLEPRYPVARKNKYTRCKAHLTHSQ